MSDKKVAVGIDIGGTAIKIAVVSTQGLVSKVNILHSGSFNEPYSLLDAVYQESMIFIRKYSRTHDVAGVGVGLPGPLNVFEERIYGMPNMEGWENIAVGFELSQRFGYPVKILNDTDAAGLGEYHYGNAKGNRYFVILSLGTGIGSAVIVNGRVWHGAYGISPEAGHIPISIDGPECGCGAKGHLESFLCAKQVVTRVINDIKAGIPTSIDLEIWESEGFPVKTVFDYAARQDTAALREVNRYAGYLGRGLAAIAALLNPPYVYISGSVANAWDMLASETLRIFGTSCIFPHRSFMKISPSALEGCGGVLGAASLILYYEKDSYILSNLDAGVDSEC
ncbi:ROK family protein [bacterium]|nr:ROK family protein [candidate division CSSED10-310 bacterium]